MAEADVNRLLKDAPPWMAAADIRIEGETAEIWIGSDRLGSWRLDELKEVIRRYQTGEWPTDG